MSSRLIQQGLLVAEEMKLGVGAGVTQDKKKIRDVSAVPELIQALEEYLPLSIGVTDQDVAAAIGEDPFSDGEDEGESCKVEYSRCYQSRMRRL
ncbi:hypothetical protein LXL04_034686 [Taraxacum kok-saghyz]